MACHGRAWQRKGGLCGTASIYTAKDLGTIQDGVRRASRECIVQRYPYGTYLLVCKIVGVMVIYIGLQDARPASHAVWRALRMASTARWQMQRDRTSDTSHASKYRGGRLIHKDTKCSFPGG